MDDFEIFIILGLIIAMCQAFFEIQSLSTKLDALTEHRISTPSAIHCVITALHDIGKDLVSTSNTNKGLYN
jgi:methanogenic corrinoid protein MtbC1